MRKQSAILCFLVFVAASRLLSQTTGQAPSLKEQHAAKAANIKKAALVHFQYFIIKADSNSYGYSIYADGNLFIEQRTIPSLQGTKGFADTASAALVARLVIQKIKQGEMPPSITPDELIKTKSMQ